MEQLKALWDTISPYLTVTGLTSIVGGIVVAIIKSFLTKASEKLNSGEIADVVSEKACEKIKNASIKTSIQPIVESGLKKVTENANEYIEATLGIMNKQYGAQLEVLKSLAKYFDSSIAITDEAKKELSEKIVQAEKFVTVDDAVAVVTVEEETPKETTQTKTITR